MVGIKGILPYFPVKNELAEDGYIMTLWLYNSLNRKKEQFIPIDAEHIRLYACGPTVYNYAHIGNARMAVVFDVLSRVLKAQYPKVTYVSNITDVDDKIMAAAKETGVAIDEITLKYESIYNNDMSALGCTLPDVQPRATGHIHEMIELIETLIDRGIAYAADGHVLFNVPAYGEAYGALSGRSRDEQIAGARVEVASYKKDPADFVLWKPSSADEPGWDSPWGYGRPGWHIECSAMAEKHLGLPFDIHGGGADLKFPHHENEIAQSCGAHGTAPDGFARVWVHNGFVTVEGEKMSKSLGNVTLVHELLEGKSLEYGMIIRLALLSAQYSKPLDWTEKRLQESEKLYKKIKEIFHLLIDVQPSAEIYGDWDKQFLEALNDDLNTPKAFSVLNALINAVRNAKGNNLPALKHQFLKILDLIGLSQDILGKVDAPQEVALGDNVAEIDALVAARTQAKADKDFKRADDIRAALTALGVEVTDTPNGPVWRKV